MLCNWKLVVGVTLAVLLTGCGRFGPEPDMAATETAIAGAIYATLTGEAPSGLSEQAAPPATETPVPPTPAAEQPAESAPTEEPATATAELVLLLPTPTPSPLPQPTATPTPAGPGATVLSPELNVRGGPGTGFAIVGSVQENDRLVVTGRNEDGSWLEIVTPDQVQGWVSAQLVEANAAAQTIDLAAAIPTLPPTATPSAPPTMAPPAVAYGLHDRQTISWWEIQPERLHNEKTVWHYGDPTTAMGTYAIVIILAKNLAPGTTSPNDTLWFSLVDERGRIYDYSEPLSTERTAMLAAAWQFVVHPTIFRDVDPGVETPMLMLWDVPQDVQSLKLVVGDNVNTVRWDLGNFSDIPPFTK